MAPTTRSAATPKSKGGKGSKANATPATTNEPSMPMWKTVGLAIAYVSLAGFSSPISQFNVSPVYGSIPSEIYHQRAITFTVLLAYMAKTGIKRNNLKVNFQNYIPVFAYYIPTIQWLLFNFSTRLGPRYGPVLTEALTYYPLLFMIFISATLILENLNLSRYGSTVSDVSPAIMSFVVFSIAQKFAIQALPPLLGTSDLCSRTGLQLLVASILALLSRSSLLLIAVPAMLHTLFANQHYTSTAAGRLLNTTLASHNFTVLDRRDSLTGYLSVVRNDDIQYMALRCDHSLLGGEWMITEDRKKAGQVAKETIYSVFTMLEAVRLIKTPSTDTPDSEKNALFIGLGVGTAPSAFMAHGINTTVVEIDPMVHKFATKYFGLPTNHTAVIEDAITFADREAQNNPETFDYIVHDVFTGGAEPTALFTFEFLSDLEKLLKEDGAIAINYAGDISLPPSRVVLNTIFDVFPTCSIYRDNLPSEEEQGQDTSVFVNLIVFCVKSERPIKFRTANNDDYLGSLARREFLPPDDGYQVQLPTIGGESKWKDTEGLKRGDESKLEEYRTDAAIRHWRIMRTVLPAAVWENW